MLKLMALITMLIDHIGAGFFENVIIYRLIGRLAFPLFAYHVAKGIRLTADLGQYNQRLLLTALIAQIPHNLYLESDKLNIVFTFYLVVVFIDEINKRQHGGLLGVSVLMLISYQYIEYGFYGMMLVISFYHLNVNIKDVNLKINKNIFYYFYPAHFVILKLIKIFF